ncbi:hypothetical protein V8F20_002724 [Naviculisporaceae sp. PSN 640]
MVFDIMKTAFLTSGEEKPPVGPKKPLADFSWDERVWQLRVWCEGDHYMQLQRPSRSDPFSVPLSDEAWPPYRDLTTQHFKDTCNRSVGIYCNSTIDLAFRPALFDYVYRRWYRPYKNDIENGRFLAKFLHLSGTDEDFDWLPRHDSERDRDDPNPDVNIQMVYTVPERPEPPRAIITTLISRHETLCQDVKKRRERYIKRISEVAAGAPNSTANRGDYYVENHHHRYILQPLFRAVIILACSDCYTNQTSETIGKMPVFLLRTGVEEGLSAPVTFDSLGDRIDASSPSYSSKDGNTIRVTLETAIDFILTLEAREMVVFGTRPDPAITCRERPASIAIFDEATQDYVAKPVEGPSHEWVDIDKHPDWIPAATNEEISFPERSMRDEERRGLMRDEMRIKGMIVSLGPGTWGYF